MQLDHVLIAVDDLASAADEFESSYGLVSVGGGRHRGWGTANRIVPLGDSYLELVALVDEADAAETVFGRWVAGAAAGLLPFWAGRCERMSSTRSRAGSAWRWIAGLVLAGPGKVEIVVG
jgi:Glyoxalase-like domain